MCGAAPAPRDGPNRGMGRASRSFMPNQDACLAGRVRSPTPSNKALTDISSSRSSQWIPLPPPLRMKLSRCSLDALRSRGKYARGTPSCRPSVSSTHMLSASNETFPARGSRAKAFIPKPFDNFLVFFSYPHKLTEFGGIHPERFRNADVGQQPEFCYSFTPPHVNMQRFRWLALIREEKKRYPLYLKTTGIFETPSFMIREVTES